MSIFNAKIQRRGGVSGKLSDQTPRLAVEITPVNEAPSATITSRGGFVGAFSRAGKIFAGAVRPLSIIYRFLASGHNRIISTHTARPISAPAVDLKAESKFTDKLTAGMAARPTVDMKADAAVKVSLSAKLVAYRRAGLRHIKSLLFKRTAKLTAARGALVKHKAEMPLSVKIQAVAAPGTVMESRYNTVKQTHEAAAISAPAEIAKVETTLTAAHTAKASTAAAVSIGLSSVLKVSHRAPLYAWFFAEQDGNTLYIPQVFSGIQAGNTLEIDLETESAYWANPIVDGNVMNLNFVYQTTQENDKLEVI